MAWMQKLYETYENNVHMIGVEKSGMETLAPIYHMNANAQLEITIDEEGNFKNAVTVAKENSRTIIPVTNNSAARSSGVAPHPLCDMLPYVAGDFEAYFGGKAEKHAKYMEALSDWAKQANAPEKVKAIYKYCAQGKIISDLIQCGIMVKENTIIQKAKIEGAPYEKCMVRWRVLLNSSTPSAVWEDKNLFESYIQYYSNLQLSEKTVDLCYVSNQKAVPAYNHPKGIVSFNYGAKLLGGNDSSGFTFRGRFDSQEQAYCVSNEVSQKAHNALKWVVANQGVFYGGKCFVCFNPKGKPVMQIDSFADFEDEREEEAYTMPAYQKNLRNTITGYRNDLQDSEDIIVMAMDAATTGRLSINYYNELKASDFYARLEQWYTTCCWYYREKIQTPKIRRIVHYAYGTQQSDQTVKADDRLLKEHSQRLMHCILDQSKIPSDIIQALLVRASTPQAYTNSNWENILFAACALIRKYRNDELKEEEWKMQLDTQNNDRSYLFGRLLAIAEKVERDTYSSTEKRETNAIRLQSAYCQRPMYVWSLLEKALIPYYQQLIPAKRVFYKNLIADIIGNLQEKDFKNLNLSLKDVYLLGYYLQRKALYTSKSNQNNENTEEE